MAAKKLHRYQIVLKGRKGHEPEIVDVNAFSCNVGNRGELVFVANESHYNPSVIAAFQPGAWQSVKRIEDGE